MNFRNALIVAAAISALMVPSFGAARQPAVDSADLTLVTPAGHPSYIIDGSEWTCSGAACHAAWVDDMPPLRSCQRVVSEIGAVTAFSYRGKSLSATDLGQCNARARA